MTRLVECNCCRSVPRTDPFYLFCTPRQSRGCVRNRPAFHAVFSHSEYDVRTFRASRAGQQTGREHARLVRTILGSRSLAGGQSVKFSGMLECGRAGLISQAGQAMPSTFRVSDACALNFPENGRTGSKSRVPGCISGQRSPKSLA